MGCKDEPARNSSAVSGSCHVLVYLVRGEGGYDAGPYDGSLCGLLLTEILLQELLWPRHLNDVVLCLSWAWDENSMCFRCLVYLF